MRRGSTIAIVLGWLVVVFAALRGQHHDTARRIGLYVLAGVVGLVTLLVVLRYFVERADRRRAPRAVAREKQPPAP